MNSGKIEFVKLMNSKNNITSRLLEEYYLIHTSIEIRPNKNGAFFN